MTVDQVRCDCQLQSRLAIAYTFRRSAESIKSCRPPLYDGYVSARSNLIWSFTKHVEVQNEARPLAMNTAQRRSLTPMGDACLLRHEARAKRLSAPLHQPSGVLSADPKTSILHQWSSNKPKILSRSFAAASAVL